MAEAIVGEIQRLLVTSIQQRPEIIGRAFHEAFQQWTRKEAFCALVAGMSGKNSWAIQKLVVVHQIAVDFLNDDCAAFWIEHHLVDILARMEHPQRLGFDVLAGLLSGYLLVDDSVQEVVENAVERLRLIHPSFALLSALTDRPESQARVALYVGLAAGTKNRLAPATSWLQRSLDLACTDKLKHRAGTELGNIYFRTGLYNPLKAVGYYSLAKDAAFRAGAADVAAYSACRLGRALCESDRFEEAQAMSEQLVEMADESEDVFVKACAEKLRGFVALMIGEHKSPSPSARASHNKRVIALLKGLPTKEKETEKDFLLGMEESQSRASSPTRILVTRSMLLDAWDQISLVETDPVAAARALSEHGKLLVATADDNVFSKVRFLKSACEFHYNRRRLKEAEAYAAELLVQADRVDLPYSKTRALVFMAEIAVEYHKSDQLPDGYSFQMIKSFLDEAEALGKPHPRLTLRVLLEQGLNFMRAERPEGAIQKLGEASRKQMELDDKFGAFNLGRIAYLETNKLSFRLLEECLIQQKRGMDALLWAERERSRDLLYNLRTSVRRRDAYLEDLANFDRDDAAALEELEGIARLAGEETMILVLAFSVSNRSAVSCYVLNWYNGELCHGSYTSQLAQGNVSSLVQMTVDDMRSGNGRQSRLLNIWYYMLVKHWEEELMHCRKFKKLVIIPQEELCMLPWAALREGEGEPFLIQKYAISIAPSLRMYKQCLLRQQALSKSQKLSQPVGLIIGNPTLGAAWEYHSLDYAEEEAHHVKEALDKWGFRVTHLEREEATKAAALDLLPSSNWVHIASHAVIDKKFPCGALLLGSTDGTVSKSRREGPSSSRELEARLRSLFETRSSTGMLRGEDLESFAADCPLQAMVVVLSACSTGLGLVYSEGILGFTRSFHMLGVPTVLASLWNVDDKSTGVLMHRLYQQLGAGLDISVALQVAIVSMIEEEDTFGCKEYEDPYHWASFLVYGSDKSAIPVRD